MRLFLKQKGPYTSSPCSIKLWQSPDQQVPSGGLMAEFSLSIFVKEQSGTLVLSHAKETVQKPCCLCTMLRGAISYPFPDRAGSMQSAKIHSPTQPRNYSADNFAKTLSLSLSYVSQLQQMSLFLKSDHRLQELWSSGNHVFQNQLHPNLKRKQPFNSTAASFWAPAFPGFWCLRNVFSALRFHLLVHSAILRILLLSWAPNTALEPKDGKSKSLLLNGMFYERKRLATKAWLLLSQITLASKVKRPEGK